MTKLTDQTPEGAEARGRVSRWIILGGIALAAAWNILPAVLGPTWDTISEQLDLLMARWWCMPIALGVVVGHWTGWRPEWAPAWGPWALLVLGLVLVGVCWADVVRVEDYRARFALAHLGLWMGAILWSMGGVR